MWLDREVLVEGVRTLGSEIILHVEHVSGKKRTGRLQGISLELSGD